MKTLDRFTLAYIECALWSSSDESTPSGGEPMDRNYSLSDISEETLQRMIEDCASLRSQADLTDYPTENAGHDFWLTRNGHGAGFWENNFGTEAQCEELTALAKQFGAFDLYIGDDGEIHH